VTASRKDASSRPAEYTQRLETAASQPAAPGPKAKADASTIFCDYDDRHRRLIDFRLPDLEGKPVRFKDIDADLVLIDFWGTWCAPCLDSIPHLVELQDRMKGKKLVVIGVACEPDSPEKAAAKVAAAARKMNMNYPVLLSKNDGKCPLQEAFRIQAFPTMILVDREGRVLWRDQGATAATLARLDRMVSDPPTQRR
jgi:thiol-disulfide isomerase/thioredoxin